MIYIKSFFEKFDNERSIEDRIKYVRGISNENKEYALMYLNTYTKAAKGKITGLRLPEEFLAKLQTEGLPSGFDMGIDNKGFFIHTHRGRSKSFDSLMDIPDESIRYVDSTG